MLCADRTYSASVLQLQVARRAHPGEASTQTDSQVVDRVLRHSSSDFAKLYASMARTSIAPEELSGSDVDRSAQIRSERRLMENWSINFLYRWFVGAGNGRGRLGPQRCLSKPQPFIDREVARRLCEELVSEARDTQVLSAEHVIVDGTLIEARTSLRFRPTGEQNSARRDDPGKPTVDFHGEKRSNQTHEFTTDPDAKLGRKRNGKTLP